MNLTTRKIDSLLETIDAKLSAAKRKVPAKKAKPMARKPMAKKTKPMAKAPVKKPMAKAKPKASMPSKAVPTKRAPLAKAKASTVVAEQRDPVFDKAGVSDQKLREALGAIEKATAADQSARKVSDPILRQLFGLGADAKLPRDLAKHKEVLDYALKHHQVEELDQKAASVKAGSTTDKFKPRTHAKG
jgi:hypothetical protein